MAETTKLDYRVLECPRTDPEAELAFLAELGAQGWFLHAVVGNRFYVSDFGRVPVRADMATPIKDPKECPPPSLTTKLEAAQFFHYYGNVGKSAEDLLRTPPTEIQLAEACNMAGAFWREEVVRAAADLIRRP